MSILLVLHIFNVSWCVLLCWTVCSPKQIIVHWSRHCITSWPNALIHGQPLGQQIKGIFPTYIVPLSDLSSPELFWAKFCRLLTNSTRSFGYIYLNEKSYQYKHCVAMDAYWERISQYLFRDLPKTCGIDGIACCWTYPDKKGNYTA